jgi:uncharacterized protein (TIGR03435 family)
VQQLPDIELLHRYVVDGSEDAFSVLVRRHVNLVYSVALRHVGNPSQAEEITQAVFVILARKAHSLRQGTVLPGWLHKTAWFAADNFRKTEIRRKNREQEAYMQSLLNEPESDAWGQIAPLLDTALAGLSDQDRNAVVLRFFNGQKLSEVGAAMGTSEEAAKKRVNRAVEKLRHFFIQRGVVLSAAVLITAISTYSVQAAPAGLAISATGTAVSGSTLALIKATLRRLLWRKLKTSIVTGIAVLLAAGIAIVVAGKIRSSSLIEDAVRNADVRSLEKAPGALVLRPTQYPGSSKEAQSGIKFVCQNIQLHWLLAYANDYPWGLRVVLPADAPQTRYDLLLTLAVDDREMLRREIQRQLGLTAHRESQMTDVLLLEMDPAKVARLKTTAGGRSMASPPEWSSAVRQFAFTNQPVETVVQTLGRQLGMPVLDRTGLSGNYDLLLQWPGQNNLDAEVLAIQKAVADQLGLRLVPGRESVEIIVVEKMRQ